ncbi:hypothetical protein CYMTET_9486, partial [Cymbomonas tetramitiformis]
MGDKMDEKARRVRSLLSSYYGSGGSEDGDGDKKDQKPRISSIDSAAFDVNHFMNSLVRGTRLDGLQSKYSEMVQEIKSLDSDMQMLVYENYSKFITATDTIRRMKTNVEGMGERMEQLLTTVNGISSKSDEVNNTLSTRRKNIEELNGVRALLKKLQVVFDLPSRLRVCLEQDALALAVSYYTGAAPILNKYGSDALSTIAAEVKVAVEEVLVRLRARLRSESSTQADVVECIELLTDMDQSLESIQMEFLAARRQRLEATLQEAAARLEPAPAAPGEEPANPFAASGGEAGDAYDPCRFIVDLNSGFLTDFCSACAACNELFPDGHKILVSPFPPPPLVTSFPSFSTDASVARELFAEYFRVASVALSPPGQPPPSAKALMSTVRVTQARAGDAGACRTLAADVGRIQRLVPEAHLQDRASEVVEKSMRQYVDAAFEKMLQGFLRELPDLSGTPQSSPGSAKPLLSSFRKVSDYLVSAVEELLQELQTLLSERGSLLSATQDIFVDLVQ